MKLPAFQFYPGDWRKDPNLCRCSHAAKGVWIDMICLMHETEERGVLSTNGVPWTEDDIVLAVGGDSSVTRAAIQELTLKGVVNRGVDGAFSCRRIVRDEKKRIICKEAGKRGGNPNLVPTLKGVVKGDAKGGVNPSANPKPTPSSSSSSSIILPEAFSLEGQEAQDEPAQDKENDSQEEQKPKEKRKRAERPRNPLIDVLATLDGSSIQFATTPALRAAGVALATIREVSPSVTVEQIQSSAKRYKEKFTSAPTAFALAKWWGSLQVPEPKSAYPTYSIGAPLTPEQKAEEEARANAMREFLRANSTTT